MACPAGAGHVGLRLAGRCMVVPSVIDPAVPDSPRSTGTITNARRQNYGGRKGQTFYAGGFHFYIYGIRSWIFLFSAIGISLLREVNPSGEDKFG